MNNADAKISSEELLKLRVNSLFSKYSEKDPSRDLEVASDYFKYLADQIDHRQLRVNGSKELASTFESVSLLIQERLLFYPEIIRNKVDHIIKNSLIGVTLATVVSLPKDELTSLRIAEKYGFLGKIIISFFGTSIHLMKKDYGLSRESLFNVKMALTQLSEVVKYASTVENPDYDTAFHELKDHFDPDLIQKTKIVAMVQILRRHADTFPNEEIGKRIMDRLDRLEEEIKRPKPRWGVIFAGFLALVGFMADLKGLDQNIYEEAYRLASNIVTALYQDGSVLATKAKASFISWEQNNAEQKRLPEPDPLPQNTAPMIIPRRREENEL